MCAAYNWHVLMNIQIEYFLTFFIGVYTMKGIVLALLVKSFKYPSQSKISSLFHFVYVPF